MFDGVMLLWFVLTGLSLVFAVIDLSFNTPVSWVQKLAWILVIAYTGPVGLFVFLLSCRSPGRGLHDAYTKASWKQGVNSEMHCLAGDATGIIICAFILSFFALSPGQDLLLEYVAAWLMGLFIFQALMMLDMFDNDYLRAVRKTIFVETVSMNMVMVGMIPVMVVMLHLLPGSDDPAAPSFWFRMSLAAVVGGVTGFPINWWLVSRGLKHGCMTLPEKGTPGTAGMTMGGDAEAPTDSGAETVAAHDTRGHQGMGHEGVGHQGMGHEGVGHQGMGHEGVGHQGMGHGHHGMEMPTLPAGQQAAWIVGTFLLLIFAVWITTWFAPLAW